MNLPVSVIIPCFNCHDTLTRAVDSIYRQIQLPEEIIFIDDGSTDDGRTLQTLYQIRDQCRLQLEVIIIRLVTNQGVASARNAGCKAATQKYIAFLDADDVWHKSKLSLQYHWMKEHPEVLLTGHAYIRVKAIEDFKLDEKINVIVKPIGKYELLFKNYFATPSVMLKNNLEISFKEGKRYSEDYWLWLHIAFVGEVYLLNIPLAGGFKAEYGESGLSSNLWEIEKGELENYRDLYNEKYINQMTFRFVQMFSLIKYMKRLFKVKCLDRFKAAIYFYL